MRLAVWIAIGLVVLAYTTALVFLAFDRNSSSASDTIRPTVITMAPVWGLAAAVAVAARRDRRD